MEKNFNKLQAELISDSKLSQEEFVEKYAKELRDVFEACVQEEIDNRMILEIDPAMLNLWHEICAEMKNPTRSSMDRCMRMERLAGDILFSKFIAKFYNNKQLKWKDD